MILRSTLSFLFLSQYTSHYIGSFSKATNCQSMISTYNYICNDLKFKDIILYNLKDKVLKCSEDIWNLTC